MMNLSIRMAYNCAIFFYLTGVSKKEALSDFDLERAGRKSEMNWCRNVSTCPSSLCALLIIRIIV